MVCHRSQYWHHLCVTHRTQTSLGSLLSLPARRNRHTIALHASAYGANIFRRWYDLQSWPFGHDVSDLASLALLGKGHDGHDFTASTEHCGDTSRIAAVREDEFCGIAHEWTRL